MSKNCCPFFHKILPIKNGQDFPDIQYKVLPLVKVGLREGDVEEGRGVQAREEGREARGTREGTFVGGREGTFVGGREGYLVIGMGGSVVEGRIYFGREGKGRLEGRCYKEGILSQETSRKV